MRIAVRTMGANREEFTSLLACISALNSYFLCGKLYISFGSDKGFSKTQELLVEIIKHKGWQVVTNEPQRRLNCECLVSLLHLLYEDKVEGNQVLFVDEDVIFNESHIKHTMSYYGAVSYLQKFADHSRNQIMQECWKCNPILDLYYLMINNWSRFVQKYKLSDFEFLNGCLPQYDWLVFGKMVSLCMPARVLNLSDMPYHVWQDDTFKVKNNTSEWQNTIAKVYSSSSLSELKLICEKRIV